MKLFSRLCLLLLLALPLFVSVLDEGRMFARAEDPTEDDDLDIEEDEAQVETTGEGEEEEEATDEAAKTQGSSDIDLTILFTKPDSNGMELPAGKLVEFLVGVSNSGDKEFIIDNAQASFRYPMDFNFYIQNFSVAAYNKAVKPQQEATVMYSFYPSEAFAGRPLGLQINLAYHDADGEDFMESVFNSTVNIVEVDEGLDGETFFLYVFLLAFAVLLLLAGHHVLTSLGVGGSKKGAQKKTQQQQQQSSVEVGTTNKNGVDYDWLPDQFKADLRKQQAAANGSAKKGSQAKADTNSSGRAAPTRTSPRLRKT